MKNELDQYIEKHDQLVKSINSTKNAIMHLQNYDCGNNTEFYKDACNYYDEIIAKLNFELALSDTTLRKLIEKQKSLTGQPNTKTTLPE